MFFTYITSRLTDTCERPYHMKKQHDKMRLLRLLNMLLSANEIDDHLEELRDFPPFRAHSLVAGMKAEAARYHAEASLFKYDSSLDIAEFSEAVLKFWRQQKGNLKAWILPARIVFAISPNSAACERVFSLLTNFFGDQRTSSLSDIVETSLMLSYNKR